MLPHSSGMIAPVLPRIEPDSRGRGSGTPAAFDMASRVAVTLLASQALRGSGYSTLRALSVAVDEGQIVLRGQVDCYFMKQRAQAVVLQAVQGRLVRNEIDVVPGSRRIGQGDRPLRGADST